MVLVQVCGGGFGVGLHRSKEVCTCHHLLAAGTSLAAALRKRVFCTVVSLLRWLASMATTLGVPPELLDSLTAVYTVQRVAKALALRHA